MLALVAGGLQPTTARSPWLLLAAIFLCAWELDVPHFNWDLGGQRVRDEIGVDLTDDETAPACPRSS